jgi:integrase
VGGKRHSDGIEVRHQKACRATAGGGRCSCSPTYRAVVWSARDRRRLTKTFGTRAEAKAWRAEVQAGLRRGTVRSSNVSLRAAAEAWLAGAAAGAIRNRSGDVYKPSVVRSYESALRLRVLPELGARRLTDVERADLQALVDRLVVDGHGASTIRNALLPVRAIYRRALVRGDVAVNPTTGLELPAVRGARERVASPDEAKRLLAALSRDRALWATAMFAGLRRGELRALMWDAVDFDRGVIRVVASWDRKAGAVAPKSRAGRRTVPMAGALRAQLAEHRLQSGRAAGLVFGRTAEAPFDPSTVVDRARKAWAKAGLISIGLHECRHTFASLMIAAGVNAKALATYMGHASVTITFDLYGHLMPGNEEEAAERLDALLDGSAGSG